MPVKFGHGEKATTYLTVAERNLAAHAKHGDSLSVDTDYLGLIEEGGKKEYFFKCTLTVQDSDRGLTLRTVTGWGRKLITIDNAFAKAETQAFGRALQHLGFVGDADIANDFDEEDLEDSQPVTETQDKPAIQEEEAANEEEGDTDLFSRHRLAQAETYARLGLTDVYIDSIDEFYVNSLQRIREETKDADREGLFNLIKGRRQALGHDDAKGEIVIEMAQKLFKRAPQQLSEEELRQMICKMDEMVKAQLESPAMSV